jgi:hypothetical protein
MDDMIASMQDVYSALIAGDAEGLLAVFATEPHLDTPLQGEVRGEDAVREFVSEQQAWLAERAADAKVLAVTSNQERIVVESELYLHHQGRDNDIPIAVVADLSGKGVSWIRTYHSTWPLTGGHAIRPPLLEPNEGLEEPEVIERYMAGISKPDLEAVLALFADNGYVREPSGSRYEHEGREGQEEFYTAALSYGGVSLKHCTVTFDGTRCAIEYICDRLGSMEIPPQAGIAVYELNDTGQIQAVRIYDDVSMPT